MDLLDLTRKLYKLTGKLSLYMYFFFKEERTDLIRIKKEINGIKQVIADIEENINIK